MNKEMLDIVNDLSKKPTTELALQIMELSSENLILKQQVKKQKEIIDKINSIIKGIAYGGNEDYYIEKINKINELLKEVGE